MKILGIGFLKTWTELIDKIQIVMTMGQDKIDKMRINVIKYFDEHLGPAGFMKKIEFINHKNIDLLINTDK